MNEKIQKKLAMGEKPNRLIHEQSPYLLQHAFNPVDWYPWGEEAFAKAKEENKPIFLSIGYSTCHWCHVMAHESFDNPEIAAVLNKWFVSVKVDREERPDIDQIYMTVTQAMTGSGGWPMSVFLMPDGSPFYAGTYFPPESRYGRPGFVDILTSLHQAWVYKRADIENVASQMISDLERSTGKTGGSRVDSDISDKAFHLFDKDFDADNGGFGMAPKFPRPVVLNFLFQYWHRTDNEKSRDIVLSTLENMAGGGIQDHLGGGFHRYATDRGWREPHFEKMLYDQAQLANSYLDAFIITGNDIFADTAGDIFNYLLRDMTSREGGFYSAEDADSEDPYNPGKHGEGAFYLWTAAEINVLLDIRSAEIFTFCYGVEANGNAHEDPQGEFKGKNILYLDKSAEQAATRFNLSVEEIKNSLQKSKQILFAKRSTRVKPHLDDKVITAWNGLMIGALARGGIILKQPRFLEAAAKAAGFIKSVMCAENGTLARRYRQGSSGLAGQLDDYAFLISGLVELYKASQDPDWLEWAVQLTERKIELFWDKTRKGFFDSIQDPSLPVRMRGHYDGAEPSGNSIAAMNLLQVGMLTGNDKWISMGKETIESFSSIINKFPVALPQMLCAINLTREKPIQVVIAGLPGRGDTSRMMNAVLSTYAPEMIVLLADGNNNQKVLEKYLPVIKSMEMINKKATAYVCQDFTCQIPVNDIDVLLSQIGKKKSAITE
ncbi:MAG: thioredoxin domain-containing protein [Desulfobulbaceae bacterium]|nr:thioredoxin domain-containing protein [Desulfobulbaceae bacterium]